VSLSLLCLVHESSHNQRTCLAWFRQTDACICWPLHWPTDRYLKRLGRHTWTNIRHVLQCQCSQQLPAMDVSQSIWRRDRQHKAPICLTAARAVFLFKGRGKGVSGFNPFPEMLGNFKVMWHFYVQQFTFFFLLTSLADYYTFILIHHVEW